MHGLICHIPGLCLLTWFRMVDVGVGALSLQLLCADSKMGSCHQLQEFASQLPVLSPGLKQACACPWVEHFKQQLHLMALHL